MHVRAFFQKYLCSFKISFFLDVVAFFLIKLLKEAGVDHRVYLVAEV